LLNADQQAKFKELRKEARRRMLETMAGKAAEKVKSSIEKRT